MAQGFFQVEWPSEVKPGEEAAITGRGRNGEPITIVVLITGGIKSLKNVAYGQVETAQDRPDGQFSVDINIPRLPDPIPKDTRFVIHLSVECGKPGHLARDTHSYEVNT